VRATTGRQRISQLAALLVELSQQAVTVHLQLREVPLGDSGGDPLGAGKCFIPGTGGRLHVLCHGEPQPGDGNK
jgi:hypothetical protein